MRELWRGIGVRLRFIRLFVHVPARAVAWCSSPDAHFTVAPRTKRKAAAGAPQKACPDRRGFPTDRTSCGLSARRAEGSRSRLCWHPAQRGSIALRRRRPKVRGGWLRLEIACAREPRHGLGGRSDSARAAGSNLRRPVKNAADTNAEPLCQFCVS